MITYKDFTIEEHIRAKFRIAPDSHIKITNIFGDTYTVTERNVKNQTINSFHATIEDTGTEYKIELSKGEKVTI